MTPTTHLFWDSCIFYAYFQNNPAYAGDIASIEQYLLDAKRGSTAIYTCSVALAEVVPSAFSGGNFGGFADFLSEFQGSITLVDLNPNVMMLAGRLKDIRYKKGDAFRVLGTGDAIMLAACIHLKEAYSTQVDAFHTFDAGKTRGLDGGKGMPLLGFESWCGELSGEDRVLTQRVISIPRSRPLHPCPSLPLITAPKAGLKTATPQIKPAPRNGQVAATAVNGEVATPEAGTPVSTKPPGHEGAAVPRLGATDG
jgi:hypothetical protein